MICNICKQAETVPGTTTVTLERDGLTLVIKEVPALVCPNCGEAYLEDATADRLLAVAEREAATGAEVAVRRYIAA
jgi:YgiT-type zinc finger domain-containing protein